MKFGIIVFPGSSCDRDCFYAINQVLGQECEYIWHNDTSLNGCDAVVLPGGSSYGDYLRPGALSLSSNIMKSVHDFALKGGLVIGIGNGFQILLETGLLPGAVLPNDALEFRCDWVNLKVENNNTPFTNLYEKGEIVRFPIAHQQGNYYAEPKIVKELEDNGQIVLRYVDSEGNATKSANPNGAAQNIAGIVNKKGNVFGLMPHPERCSENLLGGIDGRRVFLSMANLATQKGGVL
jgi:phosphoribosylformylglycinamidine synthase I